MSFTDLYTTSATATGGRAGSAKSSDDRLSVTLSVPKEMGGDGGPGTNPEQLFAAGYAACFEGALRLVARTRGITFTGVTVTADITFGNDGAGYGLKAALTARVSGVTPDVAADLATAAHAVCPYSKATRGNIPVTITGLAI